MTVETHARRLYEFAAEQPGVVAAVVGGLGLLLFWQEIGPRPVSTVMLIGGVVWYALMTSGNESEGGE